MSTPTLHHDTSPSNINKGSFKNFSAWSFFIKRNVKLNQLLQSISNFDTIETWLSDVKSLRRSFISSFEASTVLKSKIKELLNINTSNSLADSFPRIDDQVQCNFEHLDNTQINQIIYDQISKYDQWLSTMYSLMRSMDSSPDLPNNSESDVLGQLFTTLQQLRQASPKHQFDSFPESSSSKKRGRPTKIEQAKRSKQQGSSTSGIIEATTVMSIPPPSIPSSIPFNYTNPPIFTNPNNMITPTSQLTTYRSARSSSQPMPHPIQSLSSWSLPTSQGSGAGVPINNPSLSFQTSHPDTYELAPDISSSNYNNFTNYPFSSNQQFSNQQFSNISHQSSYLPQHQTSFQHQQQSLYQQQQQQPQFPTYASSPSNFSSTAAHTLHRTNANIQPYYNMQYPSNTNQQQFPPNTPRR